jgi:hypothetical protein
VAKPKKRSDIPGVKIPSVSVPGGTGRGGLSKASVPGMTLRGGVPVTTSPGPAATRPVSTNNASVAKTRVSFTTPSGNTRTRSAAASSARKETDPAKKQALLVQRAKEVGSIGRKAKAKRKTLSASVKAGTASEADKTKLANIKARAQVAKSSSSTPKRSVKAETPRIRAKVGAKAKMRKRNRY